MAIKDVLAELEKVRDELAAHDKDRARLVARRDRLIMRALDGGEHSVATIGRAAGISGVAVHKKKHGR